MSEPPQRDIWRLCDRALAFPADAERAAFLDDACGGDEALRREVESLIGGQAEASAFLETPAFAATPQLAPGTRLGVYEIVSRLGAGGMGEVYKARDTRLDRTVAIKVLPAAFASDPSRRARFEREAKAVAALTHPHICALHDVGDHQGSLFLVMEHLHGQTLAQRLEKGKLPLGQALAIATQIADALGAAHKQGVVHRDLKPANVMLVKPPTGGSSGAPHAKLLDFGLAKLRGHGEQPAASQLASTPHLPAASQLAPVSRASLTTEGTIVGTLQYMAPEQVEGKPADARTDIWALGAMLYEMVTGTPPFAGTSPASLIAAILEHEPASLRVLDPLSPPALIRLVGRCLKKDPDARWQSSADLADDLRWLAASLTVQADEESGLARRRPFKARFVPALAAGLLLLVGIGIGAELWRRASAAPARPVQRLTLEAGPGVQVAGGVAVSPDGRLVAFAGQDDTGQRIFVRHLDTWEVRAVAQGGGSNLCFSPDGTWIAYVTGNDIRPELRKVPVAGGVYQRILLLTDSGGSGSGFSGITWTADGRIAFGGDQTGIWAVPATGGTADQLVNPQRIGRPGRYSFPDVLPGGEAVLFTVWLEGRTTVCAYSLRDRRLVALIESGSAVRPRYLPSTGHLVYQSEGQLLAAPFDPARLKVGPAQIVAEQVGSGANFFREYDVSPSGVLAYFPPSLGRLVWKDRNGKIDRTPSFRPRRYSALALSADGRRAVLCVEEGTAHRLYLADLEVGEPPTRLTKGEDDWFGLFTRDGSRVLFTSGEGGRYNVASVAAAGGGQTEMVAVAPNWQRATSIWPRGPVLLLNAIVNRRLAVFRMPLTGAAMAPEPFIQAAEPSSGAVFSPDGRFIAYNQRQGERDEVFVQRYPAGTRTQVSADGGTDPAWNPRGGELFYRTSSGIMAVPITDGVRRGQPNLLFEYRGRRQPDWDVGPDGTRFLVVETSPRDRISVVLNWFEELKAKVPTR